MADSASPDHQTVVADETHGDSTSSDTALLVGVIRRRPGALSAVFERYSDDIRTETTRSNHPKGADAVVHRVFDELWRTPHLYDADSGDLREQLLRRTRALGGDGRHPDSGGRADRSLRPAPTLSAMLAALTSDERDAILLARRNGYTYRDVAIVLGRTGAAVRRDIRRGLTRLHHQMTTASNDDS